MKKYIIDNTNGSGSGCDTLFNTIDDAQRHMNFYTEREREGLEIVPIEVGFVVYVEGWDKDKRYVWDAAEIEDGGSCDRPNGYADLFDTLDEAEQLKDDVEDYIAVHDYTLSVGIEEVIKA